MQPHFGVSLPYFRPASPNTQGLFSIFRDLCPYLPKLPNTCSVSWSEAEDRGELFSIPKWTWLINYWRSRPPGEAGTRAFGVTALWVDHGSAPEDDLWFVLSPTHQIKALSTTPLAHIAPPPVWQLRLLLPQRERTGWPNAERPLHAHTYSEVLK